MVRKFFWSDPPGAPQGAPFREYQNEADNTCQVHGHGSPKGTTTQVSDYYHACNLPLNIINHKKKSPGSGDLGRPGAKIFFGNFA